MVFWIFPLLPFSGYGLGEISSVNCLPHRVSPSGRNINYSRVEFG